MRQHRDGSAVMRDGWWVRMSVGCMGMVQQDSSVYVLYSTVGLRICKDSALIDNLLGMGLGRATPSHRVEDRAQRRERKRYDDFWLLRAGYRVH